MPPGHETGRATHGNGSRVPLLLSAFAPKRIKAGEKWKQCPQESEAIIPPICSALFERKKALDLVRENQQSSALNFVKDFSSIFLKSGRSSPLKKGVAAKNLLENGKATVQTMFAPLPTAISSMELSKNFENKKLPNPLR